jgi:predicted NBD/HSP70 family sugar kinase
MRKYYVGLDVHKVTIAIAVLDAYGKVITRTVIEISTEAVRDFLRNLRRNPSHFRRRQPRRLALRHRRTTGQASGRL